MGTNRRTKIKFPVYRSYTVTVIQCCDLVRTGKRLGVDLTNCAASLVLHPKFSLRCWLLFETEVSEETIAHEASHAVRAMFRSVGVRCDDETFAYHLGYLVARLHKFLK